MKPANFHPRHARQIHCAGGIPHEDTDAVVRREQRREVGADVGADAGAVLVCRRRRRRAAVQDDARHALLQLEEGGAAGERQGCCGRERADIHRLQVIAQFAPLETVAGERDDGRARETDRARNARHRGARGVALAPRERSGDAEASRDAVAEADVEHCERSGLDRGRRGALLAEQGECRAGCERRWRRGKPNVEVEKIGPSTPVVVGCANAGAARNAVSAAKPSTRTCRRGDFVVRVIVG